MSKRMAWVVRTCWGEVGMPERYAIHAKQAPSCGARFVCS
jgi:hypothetical protein